MSKVKYKQPSSGMDRMLIKQDSNSRPSVGLTEIKAEIYYLSPDIIIPYKNQARKNITDESLVELAVSIQSQGILQPLQVIPSLENQGKFEVVSGERRLMAAKKIHLETVPCMILDRDRDADEIALIENIQREDLHPIELAEAIGKLLDGKKQGSQSELAERIGMSKQQISHLFAISRLPEDVKQYFLQQKTVQINVLKSIAYLKDENSIREKVFRDIKTQNEYRSILRISFDGESFKFDHLKIDQLSPEEKERLRVELINFMQKL